MNSTGSPRPPVSRPSQFWCFNGSIIQRFITLHSYSRPKGDTVFLFFFFFNARNCWFPCVFAYSEALWRNLPQLSNVFNLHFIYFLFVRLHVERKGGRKHMNSWSTREHAKPQSSKRRKLSPPSATDSRSARKKQTPARAVCISS